MQKDITVMSYNIRFGSNDLIDDPNRWLERKYLVNDIIKKNKPDIIGMQEALIGQINFLDSALNDYYWVGVGRDDGFNNGEFSPIFYLKERFEIIAKGTFWLSTTPYKPSIGWDAALKRICTWVQLKDLNSGQLFFVYNTHFDHIGQHARYESSKLILKRIREETGDFPILLIGDFNYTSSSDGYKLLTDTSDEKMLYDAQFISAEKHTGGNVTFNGYGELNEPVGKIDFIFVSENISVVRHMILKDKYKTKFPSDHFPVLSKISFK